MFGARLHVVGERGHLDVRVRVPAEMPVAAFLVGQHRIDRRIVEEQHFLAGVALVVFRHEVLDRGGERRAVALGNVADAGVDRLLHLDQGLLGVELVVVGGDLELVAGNAAMRIGHVGEILEGFQANLADARPAAGERIDIGDLDGVLSGRGQRRDHGGGYGAEHGAEARNHGRPPFGIVVRPLGLAHRTPVEHCSSRTLSHSAAEPVRARECQPATAACS